MAIEVVVPARAGLVGHPSDGYGGATLAVTLHNFAAHVELHPSAQLCVEPADAGEWPEGGEPLIHATVRRFCRHCAETGAPYQPHARIRYRSTIPREVGLAGSSAIVIATLRALARHGAVAIERERLPALALSVETDELGIAAGLQDRVVQTYGGLVFVDVAEREFTPLDAGLLPELFVAWRPGAAGSSALAHAAVRERYARGDAVVHAAMSALAALAHEACAALVRGDHAAFAEALDAGLDVRARIFELDPRHLAMVQAARALGLPATYTGSGGAIVGIASDRAAVAELTRRLEADGVVVVEALATAQAPAAARPSATMADGPRPRRL